MMKIESKERNLVPIPFDEVKSVLLEIMTDLDKFCRENGLRYSLAYGTLIGAIRHKGFIPWDDDIDILMPREDYVKLLETYSHPYYVIESQEKDSSYPLNFAKLCDKRTLSSDQFGNTSSVAVDIFILDGLPAPLEDAERRIGSYKRLSRLWSSQIFTRHLSLRREYGVKKNLLIVEAKLLHVFISEKKVVDKLLHFRSRYSVDKSEFCASITGVCTIYESARMLKYIDWPFEDRTFRVFEDYDYPLRLLFGDYMKLPPESERYNHEAQAYWIR
jgi:lipopolysaccharide cholinephosphotransferase